jgi:phosphate transport system permease protein
VVLVENAATSGWAGFDYQFVTTGPEDSGRAGGILPILISTSEVIFVAIGISLPVSFGAALFLAGPGQLHPRTSRALRASSKVLAGTPSIVFGLCGNTFFCQFLGFGYSILSGGLTLAFMIVPVMTSITESGIRNISPDLTRGAAALSFSYCSLVRYIILPGSAQAILAGAFLGIGRAAAETAALLYTSGYSDRMPETVLDSGRTLAVHIYDLSMNIAGGDRNAAATCLVLIFLVLLFNLLAASVGNLSGVKGFLR